MKNHPCLKLFATSLCLLSTSLLLHGGAFISKDMLAEVGTLEEQADSIKFSSPSMELTMKKSSLLWYNTDPEVKNFLKASEKAEKDKASPHVIRKLLEESIRRETSTVAEAKIRLKNLDDQTIAKMQNQPPYREPLTIGVGGGRVATSQVGPYTAVDISYDSVDFAGFINYNTSAISNGQQFTFTIPMPIFDKTSINTSVIVGPPNSSPIGGYTSERNSR